MSQTQRETILVSFPAKCSDTFRSELSAVIQILNGGTKKARELRTVLSRRIHFLWYCTEHGILQYFFFVNKEKAWTQLMLNYTLAAYAIFAATGHTILYNTIQEH